MHSLSQKNDLPAEAVAWPVAHATQNTFNADSGELIQQLGKRSLRIDGRKDRARTIRQHVAITHHGRLGRHAIDRLRHGETTSNRPASRAYICIHTNKSPCINTVAFCVTTPVFGVAGPVVEQVVEAPSPLALVLGFHL